MGCIDADRVITEDSMVFAESREKEYFTGQNAQQTAN
jgi:hypothetical protein